jgi:hypothetical protein
LGSLSKPEWAEGAIWLSIQPELKALPAVEIKFYGRGKRGGCNFTCSAHWLPQHACTDVRLKRGVWQSVLNLACQARLGELSENQPETGWMTFDGATISVALCFRNDMVVRQRTQPELRYARLVNLLLDLCPILDPYPNLRQLLYCNYLENYD